MGFFFRFEATAVLIIKNGSAQVVPHQDQVGQKDETEQAYPTVGAHEDRQHHQVQCQEASLEAYKAEVVNLSSSCKGWQDWRLSILKTLKSLMLLGMANSSENLRIEKQKWIHVLKFELSIW